MTRGAIVRADRSWCDEIENYIDNSRKPGISELTESSTKA